MIWGIRAIRGIRVGTGDDIGLNQRLAGDNIGEIGEYATFRAR